MDPREPTWFEQRNALAEAKACSEVEIIPPEGLELARRRERIAAARAALDPALVAQLKRNLSRDRSGIK